MSRAFLIVMDGVGCGNAPDAAQFGDLGANTLGHIVAQMPDMRLPNLNALGLGAAIEHNDPTIKTHWPTPKQGGWAIAQEVSKGKDTPSGHWELAGVPVPWDWHYFERKIPAWPPKVLNFLAAHAGGSLANCHASGEQVIATYAAEHIRTRQPICYTSVDSVFQIAAHETYFGLSALYELCRSIAPMLHEMRVGRVIARPFEGDIKTGFQRTINRKDFAILPPKPTLCDWAFCAGRYVGAIGKIGDIFSMRGISECHKGTDAKLMTHLEQAVLNAPEGSLTFANFVRI